MKSMHDIAAPRREAPETDISEAIEKQALPGWHEVVSRLKIPGYDWKLEQVDDALCRVSATEPSILINRVLGLGSQTMPTLDQLVEIQQLYRKAGVSRFFLHLVPQIVGPEMEELLLVAGYRRHRGWMKFERGTDDIDPIATDLTIRQIGPEQAADFAAIVGSSFDMVAASQAVIAAVSQPSWTRESKRHWIWVARKS